MPRGDRGGKSKGSGIRCVAANCGNTHKDGFSLHFFPKEPTLRRTWTEFVKVKRANWHGPTDYSALCSFHFTADSFLFRQRFEAEQMGIKPKKVKLNEDAFPTVHAVASNATSNTHDMNTPSTSTDIQENVATPKHSSVPRLLMLSPTEDATCQSSPPKKIRRGYLKRETARIISAYEEETKVDSDNDDTDTAMEEDEELPNTLDMEEGDVFELDEVRQTTTSIGCQVKFKTKQRSKHCQTNLKSGKSQRNMATYETKSIGVQTESFLMLPEKPVMKDAFQLVRPDYFEPVQKVQPKVSESSVDEPFSSPFKDDQRDATFDPNMSPMSSDEEIVEDEIYNNNNRNLPPEEENKYLVFESNLMELFGVCTQCCSPATAKIVYINGSLVKIKQACPSCKNVRNWCSQPFVGSKPAGNLLISAGILFSGSVPSKILRMYNFMKLASISMSTYINHQKFYLYPAIGHVWHNYQNEYVHDVTSQNRSVVVGGDGRADTPGHSAKYGSYNMIDLDEGVVVDIQLVQSNEVKSSCHMEKEGLVRSVEFFKHHNIKIKSIVTDRHVQIVKWVRENMTETTHYFDVWHVAKGMKKKLVKLSNEKECSELQPWIKSLVNHMYWTAATSLDQSKEMILAKWSSVGNHIINIHSEHSTLFPDCQHGPLEGRERQKKWLKPGTKVFEKLLDLINSNQMKRDIPMLSPGQQTSALEGYHSVINHFAPKMLGFSYHGMLCRLWLAALHFNENSQREQATTRDGRARYNIVFPKYKKGGHTVRRVLVDCTYEYVQCLMRTAFGIAKVPHMNDDGIQLLVEIPPPLCSDYVRPDKDMAIQNLLSRLNRCQPDGNQCSSGQGR